MATLEEKAHHATIVGCCIAGVCLLLTVFTAFITWKMYKLMPPPTTNPPVGDGAAVTPFWILILLCVFGLLSVIAVAINARAWYLQSRPKRERVPNITPDEPSRLKIISAQYGVEGKDADATDRIINRVIGDSLAGRVGADLFGAWDPLDGVPKRLKVEYSFGNQEKITVDRDQHELLFLPESTHLKGLQEKALFLARDLSQMLYSVGAPPLLNLITSGEPGEENKQSMKLFEAKLFGQYKKFDGRLWEIKERFEVEGISEQPLDQFRGNTSIAGIRELVRTLYKIAMQIDEGYPKT
jgi:hypothetical protein